MSFAIEISQNAIPDKDEQKIPADSKKGGVEENKGESDTVSEKFPVRNIVSGTQGFAVSRELDTCAEDFT
jgi:hypothetical protein